MLKIEFNNLLHQRLNKIVGVLENKAAEYSQDYDRLHNFKAAANIKNITPEEALDGMLMKHYVSYRDILNNINNNIVPSKALLNEKIGDIINYFILFEMLVIERIDNEISSQLINFNGDE